MFDLIYLPFPLKKLPIPLPRDIESFALCPGVGDAPRDIGPTVAELAWDTSPPVITESPCLSLRSGDATGLPSVGECPSRPAGNYI